MSTASDIRDCRRLLREMVIENHKQKRLTLWAVVALYALAFPIGWWVLKL